MRFLNHEQLIRNGVNTAYRELRRDALGIIDAAICAADPFKAVLGHVRLTDGLLRVDDAEYRIDGYDHVYVIGGGKAGAAMAAAMEHLLGNRIAKGIVNIPDGAAKPDLNRIKLNEASHPVPDERGVSGVEEMLRLVGGASERDLVFFLVSGGGSALMPYPAQGVTLRDLQITTSALMRRGATINDINAVRKHLDGFKGGQLLRMCGSADVVSLIISDVVSDPLDTIASGPTSPDPTTYGDAVAALRRNRTWKEAPPRVKERLARGESGAIPETPKPGDAIFRRVLNVIVANNGSAVEAARREAERLGYNALVLSTMVEGEARHVGSVYASVAREVLASGRPIKTPAAIISGGETTVNVTGKGNGGRNQELVLSAARRISGLPCLIASVGTDGVDGPTDAAGAIADGETATRSALNRLDMDAALRDNDSYGFFSGLQDMIKTGQTGTNVNDVHLILVKSE